MRPTNRLLLLCLCPYFASFVEDHPCNHRSATHFTKTVVVEDTMVPIISLEYKGNKLMAESTTSSVNGWVIGAVASAVSGVALLGYAATRKATVATSVPV